jgi:hypothetical protein
MLYYSNLIEIWKKYKQVISNSNSWKDILRYLEMELESEQVPILYLLWIVYDILIV